ncbi:alpha/beta hydrolase [Micromonospora sp. NPDC000207]|uniref:alpha/beta fold hydrolase n=1 Tax=Micromonospora sp. NPDC000207 TaxID=3154246 RepID=UPI00332B6BBF
MINDEAVRTAPATPATSHTLAVPGARLHYELRGQGPLVALVGAPMDARSFEPLAELLADDHTVLTTDPRGIYRSALDDPEQDSTPELRADDLSRILAHVGAGPATVLGSSGGAITALALVQRHPEQVHTVVAHEPPVDELLDDRDEVHAQTEEVIAAYRAGDVTGAWRKFLAQANIFLPDEVFEQMFGGERDPQRAADERFWFLRELLGTTRWQPDVAALRAAPTRIVVGIGDESAGQSCDRTSRALARLLDVEPTAFPGGHTGFVEQAAAFEGRLRTVLGRQ